MDQKGGDAMKKLMIGSTVMTVLVLARCIATVFIERYYGRTEWLPAVLADPWFYVGVTAAAVVLISAMVILIQTHKREC